MTGGDLLDIAGFAAGMLLAAFFAMRLLVWLDARFERAIEDEFGPSRPDEALTRWRDEGQL